MRTPPERSEFAALRATRAAADPLPLKDALDATGARSAGAIEAALPDGEGPPLIPERGEGCTCCCELGGEVELDRASRSGSEAAW